MISAVIVHEYYVRISTKHSVFICFNSNVLIKEFQRQSGRTTYLGAMMKNDVSRREGEERRVLAQG